MGNIKLEHNPAMKNGTAVEKQHFSIVVAGEFNSGKSSVINLLLRQKVLPVSVGYSLLPPVSIFPSDQESYEISPVSGETNWDKDTFLAGKVDGRQVREIIVKSPYSPFNGAVISEVSVREDGRLDAASAAVLEAADLLIWCTMGQRAWCLSEITIVEQLPKSLLDTAHLAVTRADYLRSATDRTKVETRLEREAADFFDKISMLDCSRNTTTAAGDDTVWAESGGQDLFGAVMAEFKKSDHYRSVRLVPPLPQPKSLSESFEAWQKELDDIKAWISAATDVSDTAVAEFVKSRIHSFSASVLATTDPVNIGIRLRDTFDQAASFIAGRLDNANTHNLALCSVELVLQLETEFGRPDLRYV